MFTRRDFLKGVGVAGAAAAALPALPGLAQEAGETPDAPDVLGPGPVPVTLRVDGKAVRLEVEPRVTLLDALRDRLGVTGPKKACDRGACGACTVLRDGVPILACSTLAIENEGGEITTIAGLGTPEKPHPLQTAFVEHDALQCGFCTPGMVTALSALFARRPDASLEAVKDAISGNLCRCGTYPKIFDAALAARGKGR